MDYIGAAMTPTLDFRMNNYAAGGMVGQDGMPVRPGISEGGAMANVSPEMVQQSVQQFMQQHPQQVAQIKQVMEQAVASGELSPDELNQIVQLTQLTLQNPDMYPYVRRYAIQQGLASEDQLPTEYDAGLVYVLAIAAQSVLSSGQQTQAPMQAPPQAGLQAPQGVPSMAGGGVVRGPGTGTSDSVPIRASAGEYVIPAHIVQQKGREFFDNLLKKYP